MKIAGRESIVGAAVGLKKNVFMEILLRANKAVKWNNAMLCQFWVALLFVVKQENDSCRRNERNNSHAFYYLKVGFATRDRKDQKSPVNRNRIPKNRNRHFCSQPRKRRNQSCKRPIGNGCGRIYAQ
ncbi:hypothetical protein L596_021280 [Steinernema carpocapsae]|uniref:Uncharacterized protein n=1 Tax=Steinernema carpocapsae TaxID=34508 RepID=A0A4U5MI63_STECR|nr:hypothetical protein L596_021280 [Steinernema carpocapsae]